MIGIYKLTSPSGKSYVGQSVDIERRFKKYRSMNCKSQYGIYNAIVKYGFDSFNIDILHEIPDCENACDVLNELEIDEIIKHNTLYPNGYNMVSGGRNYYASDEHKKRLSEAHKGKAMLPQTAAALIAANTGRIVSDETREKIASKQRGIKKPKEMIDKLRLSRVGKSLSSEHKAKISKSLVGVKKPEEFRYILAKVVYKLDMDYNFIEKFKSLSDAARSVDTEPRRISACYTGVRKSHLGYRWVSEESFENIMG